MATTAIAGSTVVFSNSGAAANLCNTSLTEDSLGEITFDVLAASGGGKNTTIYSVDDASVLTSAPVVVNKGMTGYNTDLLYKDGTGSANAETTAVGGKFWIGTDAKIHYDASGINPDLINGVAVGSSFDDTFQYTIKMANGTLAVGTLTVKITNTNDGPTISAFTDGNVTEDADGSDAGTDPDAIQTATGTITFDDADLLDTHTVSDGVADAGNIYGGTLTASITDVATGAGNGTVTWNYSVNNNTDAFQSLGATATATEKFTVTISDGHGGTIDKVITVTLHGINDDPELDNVDAGTINDTVAVDTSFANLTGTLLGSDVDNNDAGLLTYGAQGADGFGDVIGTYGTLHVDSNGDWTYTANAAAIDALGDGDSDTDAFTVVISDGHGGSSTATLTVNVNGADEPLPPPPPGNTIITVATPVDPTVTGDPNDNDGSGNIVGTFPASAGNGVNDTLYGGIGNDVINSGSGNDTVYGGSGNDTLNGGNDLDTLYGGSGIDTINGGGNPDTIIGGWSADIINVADGNDTVRFLSTSDTGDTISGFGAGDVLDFSPIDADPATANDTFLALVDNGTTPIVTAHSLTYFDNGVDTTIWADTDGNTGTVELQVTLLTFTGSLSGSVLL